MNEIKNIFHRVRSVFPGTLAVFSRQTEDKNFLFHTLLLLHVRGCRHGRRGK